MLTKLKIKTLNDSKQDIDCGILIGYLFQDIRPPKGIVGLLDWRLNGLISKLIKEKKLTGKFGETSLIATQGKISTPKFLLIGCGKYDDLNLTKLTTLWNDIVTVISKMKLSSLGIPFEERLIKVFNIKTQLKLILELLVIQNKIRQSLKKELTLYCLFNGNINRRYEITEYINTVSNKDKYKSIIEHIEENEGLIAT